MDKCQIKSIMNQLFIKKSEKGPNAFIICLEKYRWLHRVNIHM